MSRLINLSNYKHALISGASAGIGEEFAKQLHALGLRVCLIARREERLRKIVNDLNSQRANSAEFLVCDLCDFHGASGIQIVLDYIRNNPVDILINNAGRGSFGSFDQLSIASEVGMLSLNVEVTMRLAHAVLPRMKAERSGAIVSISSLAAFQPLPYMATYAATKAFNHIHSLALRQELKAFNIRVLTVCPGPTATEFGGVARVPGTAAGMTRDRVSDVVTNSLKALSKNKALVIPSQRSWVLSWPSRLLPQVLTTFFVGRSLGKVLALSKADLDSPKD